MTLIRPVWVALLLALSFLVGCASTPDQIQSGAAHQIAPLSQSRSASTGWLVARVDGNPRDIEYYVNGIRIEPEEPIEWWKDARISIQLRPGLYDVEARYLVRAFAGRGIEYRILTRAPVEVRPGVETEVEARLEKDWRGVPASETAYFVPVTEERRARQAAAAEAAVVREGMGSAATVDNGTKGALYSSSAVPVTVDPQVTPEILEEVRRADALALAQATDQIVIQGNGAGAGDGVVRIQNAEDTTPQPSQADNIVIPGSASQPAAGSTLPGATTSAASPASDVIASTALVGAGAVGATQIPSAPPEQEPDVQPEASTPVVLEGADDFGITIHIESDPPGAMVVVDEQEVGRSPVDVRLDPRADHIIEFTRDGCGDYVRLLSSTSWREGRDTSVHVELYCD